jgi:hypothetical protein
MAAPTVGLVLGTGRSGMAPASAALLVVALALGAALALAMGALAPGPALGAADGAALLPRSAPFGSSQPGVTKATHKVASAPK